MGDANPILLFLQSFVTQIGGYLAVVGLLFAVFWVWGERVFARRRVQKVKLFTTRQLRHELLYTLVTFLAGTGSAGVVLVMHAQGKTSIVDTLVPGQEVLALAWIVGIVVFNDGWFYAWHRLLHTPRMFRLVHAVHHKSVDVNPFSSYSFHAFEGFILGAWIIPAAIFLPIPMPALGLVQVVGLLNNVNSHLGYELLPSWWVKIPPFKWTASSTYHNLHHQKLKGNSTAERSNSSDYSSLWRCAKDLNYALFFRFWDRIFGTELPGYEEAFVDRSEARGVKAPS